MDLDDQIKLEHILFLDRKCRVCGKIKSLIDEYYLTRKGRGAFPSAYSYECKNCTKKRIIENRKKSKKMTHSNISNMCEYPDW